ncbi:sugar phosphate isomerase/epimerase [Marinobacterium sp. D7]|uniref:sugar phosphate isomerase/epimerase family protein n=1 Tax=Marinobacterium ramblicola TaxID=2849041 RepID=UPI001C2DECC4|nr:TIM barrel protein [Marinobacterium ramblicola]MBV1789759.1 sugar phosphate isomerase/epimerase [Marinobacterium ramblicola]
MSNSNIRSYTLGPLTVLELSAPEIISVAAHAGYDAVGLRLLPSTPGGIYHPLIEDKQLLARTLQCMSETGVRVYDLEIVRINEQFDANGYKAFLDTGAELGAQCVLVAGDDPDLSRFSDNFAAFCDACQPYGMKPNLEFMPWTEVKDLRQAMNIVASINRPNAGVLIDAIHFDRSHSLVSDIQRIPVEQLHYAQICDAPAEKPSSEAEVIRQAREERLLPGAGGIPLDAIFSRLPKEMPVCVEIPSPHLGDAGNRARLALEATKSWFSRHIDRE